MNSENSTILYIFFTHELNFNNVYTKIQTMMYKLNNKNYIK